MILSNQVHCNTCGDEPFSANRHDFKSCKCGAISVDGGMDYLRRCGAVHGGYTDMSIEIPDPAYKAAIEGIKWANENGRNELGLLCAVARNLRDNGVKMVSASQYDKFTAPDSEAEQKLEAAAFAARNDPSLPSDVRVLIDDLWREVVARQPFLPECVKATANV